MRDDGAFTVEKQDEGSGGITIPGSEISELVPGEVDGELHASYRRVLNPLFSRKTIEALRPVVERVTRAALDRIATKREFDAVADYATAIPLEVTFDYLAVEIGDPLAFLLEVEHAFHGTSEGWEAKWSEWEEIVKRARLSGNDGVIAKLGRIEELKFSDRELVSIMLSAVLGGVRTTAAAISHGIWFLDKNPILRKRLRTDRSLIRAAVEEFLRYFSPAAGVARTAMCDVELGSVTLHAGDRVLASIDSGNHDESVFANPETVDLDRVDKSESGLWCRQASLSRHLAHPARDGSSPQRANHAVSRLSS